MNLRLNGSLSSDLLILLTLDQLFLTIEVAARASRQLERAE
jgi:hypothetical protein